MALYDIKVNEWDRTRDYYVAQTVAALVSSKDNPVNASELLAHKYRAPNVKFTESDPDEGAVWEGVFPEGQGEDVEESE